MYLAIIQLETPIALEDENKGRLCLPENENSIPEDKKGCYGTGWGIKNNDNGELADILQQVRLDRVPRSKCNASGRYQGRIKETQTCSGVDGGGKDT